MSRALPPTQQLRARAAVMAVNVKPLLFSHSEMCRSYAASGEELASIGADVNPTDGVPRCESRSSPIQNGASRSSASRITWAVALWHWTPTIL
jgi:hypothetical protein